MFKNDEEKIERMTLNPVFNSFVNYKLVPTYLPRLNILNEIVWELEYLPKKVYVKQKPINDLEIYKYEIKQTI
tara:strand:+ start:684 stop:902 length:219 start_codon:yes stop_codon:yes gene_type:complete